MVNPKQITVTVPGMTQYTGTVPNKATQTKEEFANAVHPYLNYFNSTFTPNLTAVSTALTTFKTEVNELAVEVNTNASETKTARDEAVNAISTITPGAIDNTTKAANKTYSNEKVDELLTNIDFNNLLNKPAIPSNINELDDYEDGTFTPYFVCSGNAPTLTYSLQEGRYVKIGNLVTVTILLNCDVTDIGTGYLKIYGLPFSCSQPYPSVNFGIFSAIEKINTANETVSYLSTNRIYITNHKLRVTTSKVLSLSITYKIN